MKHLKVVLNKLLIHRRVLASVAAMVSVFAICAHVGGGGSTMVDAYAATSRIPPGSLVDSAQVHSVLVPIELLPQGVVTDISSLAGQMTAAPIPAGAILTADHFVAASQATPGAVIIPLTVSAQLLTILNPGDHVSVFFTNLTTGEVSHTGGIRVVTIPAGGSGMFSSGGDYILVEVASSIATEITAAAAMATITVAIE